MDAEQVEEAELETMAGPSVTYRVHAQTLRLNWQTRSPASTGRQARRGHRDINNNGVAGGIRYRVRASPTADRLEGRCPCRHLRRGHAWRPSDRAHGALLESRHVVRVHAQSYGSGLDQERRVAERHSPSASRPRFAWSEGRRGTWLTTRPFVAVLVPLQPDLRLAGLARTAPRTAWARQARRGPADQLGANMSGGIQYCVHAGPRLMDWRRTAPWRHHGRTSASGRPIGHSRGSQHLRRVVPRVLARPTAGWAGPRTALERWPEGFPSRRGHRLVNGGAAPYAQRLREGSSHNIMGASQTTVSDGEVL